MPLQIEPEVYKWLQGLTLVKEGRRNQNNLMEINQQQSSKLMDGFVFAIIFRSLFKHRLEEQKFKKLQSLKQHSTPAIRLYNWGILTQLLKQVGYNLQNADKSKITNYQAQPLAKVLHFLYDIKAKDPNNKQMDENALKVDINQIGKKSLQDATNSLQFLTISISKNFKISPQQTLNLFLDNNKYLSHLLAKGVKNSFVPIQALLLEVRNQVEFIVGRLFCLDEEQNVNFLLNALKTCLISRDQSVASKCCEFLIQLYEQYKTLLLNLHAVRKWTQTQGINTLFFCIKKYPSLAGLIYTICYNFLDDQFFRYIQLSQKSILWSTQQERFSFYKNFIEEVDQQILNQFVISNQFQEWNKMFIKIMKKTKDKQEIIMLMAIMEEQWNRIQVKFQQSQLGLPNCFITFLRSAVMMPNQLLFLQSTRTLFSLMKTLGSVKNPFAPLIYKILITTYSAYSDIGKIVYMSDNFIVSFKGITGLPGSPLVQPLLKNLENSKQWSVIELATLLVEQKRIEEEASLDVIQMLTKIAFNDIRFGNLALDSIFDCVQQLNEQNMSGYLQDNTKFCLAQLYSLSKSTNKSIKHLKQELQHMKGSEGNQKAVSVFVAAASKHILCKNMIGFISKAIIIDQDLKNDLESSVFHTFIKIKVELKKVEQADLLRPIMASYYPQEDQLQERISFYMNEAYPPKPEPEPRKRGHSHNHLSKSVTLKTALVDDEANLPVILNPSQLKPSNFAIKDLQRVKQKRYDLKTIEIQRQKERVIKEERTQKFKTIQHEKRLVESMSSIKNDIEYKNLQTIEEKPRLEPQTHQVKETIPNNIKLLNLQKQQEEPYREDAESVLRKYRKVWRYLFFKYSIKKTQGEEKVHQGQAWKMLKDYDVNYLRKEDTFTLVRLVNEQLKRKNDIQFLNYDGFEDFILQAATVGYSKGGYGHLPPGRQLEMFVEQLKKVTKEKSGSVEIFQNPEQAYFQQNQVIREYNSRLRENPDYILPQGYKKIKQTSLQFEYDVHPMLQRNITSPFIDVLQIIDSFISKHPKLGFHIIEPLSIKSETFLAKPFLFQQINQKMKDYSKGYLQPKRSISAVVADPLNLPSPPAKKKQFKPYVNFSLGIKLGIAEASLKNKSIAEQVAYCMQDILNAIQRQSPVVKKGRRRVTNDFMRRKKNEMTKLSADKKKDEVDWKKRAESVKLQVEALRQKKKITDREKKKREFVDRKTKKQKEQKLYKSKMTEFQRVKAQISKKKQALEELRAVQEEKIKTEKAEYRLGVQDYFRRKKEDLMQKEQEYKRKKEQQKYKKEESDQLKKEFVKRLYLSNLKREEQVLEKVQEVKDTYDDVWKSSQIQQVLSEKKKSLKLLFDLLLKYEKSKISATNYDQIGLATLNFFSLKFKLTPFFLQRQDVSKIFTYATKGDDDKKTNRKGINFDKFLEVLFLIATKAKKTLNKIIQKRRKKQQKIQAFLNAQKSAGGNHFEANEVQQSQSQQQSQADQKPTLQDEYLFNAEDVEAETLEEVISFLRLPSEKADMEQRYKQALEVKTSKPRTLLVKQMKQSLDI